ncbi:cation diffusion facilitator family transporter [Pontibacter ummariensis]|uniref:Cation diffusion facilitator family transporter n=1 Tax=Pontibacter ummariensis TaxID=1610492 RepID=A0A239BTN3_9BACT|nr:cation diffusion facilitator family transporter [Pontibacter ummariensis]PRY15626.1 cation diffusion facilitator family transporter [Pontibacter ummariensis]SNS11266.1 cation diffusion facilitator family transporter [Pontibacter ummariensis]
MLFGFIKRQNENVRLQIMVVAVGVLLLLSKFVAFFLTNSNAILTDALESIINVVAGAFSLYSLILSARPRDENHPYGHGKIEFIAATLEGSLILIAGGIIIFKSVYNLIEPVELNQLDFGIILIAVSGAVNYGVGYLTVVRGKQSKSMVLTAGGRHLMSDAYSTAGILVGLLLIYLTGQVWLDSAVAILFGLIICFTGFRILRGSVAGIMDEADYELLKDIVKVLNENRRPNWIDIHNLRVIKYGSTLHIDCHLTVPWYLNVLEAHDEVEAVGKVVREKIDPSIELFIHTDPCIEPSCAICTKENCNHRQHPYKARVEWEFEKVIADRKHRLDE